MEINWSLVKIICWIVYLLGSLASVCLIWLSIEYVTDERGKQMEFPEKQATILFLGLIWFIFWPVYYFSDKEVAELEVKGVQPKLVLVVSVEELIEQVKKMTSGEEKFFRINEAVTDWPGRMELVAMLPIRTGKSMVVNFVNGGIRIEVF